MMPHLVLVGEVDVEALLERLPREVRRWGPAVLKTEEVWRRSDGRALLVEGVVVEHSRPLHPIAVVAEHRGNTRVSLWRKSPVERTPAIQRWLATVASDVLALSGGTLRATNMSRDLLEDLGFSL
jgi:hypothetical protein